MPHNKSVPVPVGKWVKVPADMVVAPGTYVDTEGYLRFSANDSYAVWHRNIKGESCSRLDDKDEQGNFKPIGVDEIVMVNGVPWCSTCVGRGKK